MRLRRTTSCLVLGVLALSGASGCGAADDVARAGAGVADDVARAGRGAADDLARSGGAAEAGAVQAAVDETAAALIARNVRDLDAEDQRKVVQAACSINDGAEIATADDLGDAAESAIAAYGGRPALRFRVASLAEDLGKAKSSGDIVAVLAVAGVCEAV